MEEDIAKFDEWFNDNMFYAPRRDLMLEAYLKGVEDAKEDQ